MPVVSSLVDKKLKVLSIAGLVLGGAWTSSAALAASSPASPEIRITTANPVPTCVTPERLMRFIKSRNDTLEPRFNDIARWYKHHGSTWRVRWDYAFFQMIVETNFLQFKRGNGQSGDVKPRQNNFAGIGTTGGGVPGDSYPDVKTGVLAHIQHLVAYSGEKLAQPIAPRTQLKQGDIVEVSLKLGRPVRFSDLARRWAVDRQYGSSIAAIADRFREGFCTGQQAEDAPPSPAPAVRRVAIAAVEPQPSHLGMPPSADPTHPGPVQVEPKLVEPPTKARAVPPPAKAAAITSPVRTIWRAQSGQRQPPVADAPVSAPVGDPVVAVAPPPAVVAPAALPAVSPPAPAASIAPPSPPQAAGAVAAETPSAQQRAPLTNVAAAVPPATATTPPAPAASASGNAPACSVASASYGGRKTLLIKHQKDGGTVYTALSVLDGFERSMTDVFVRDHAPGGSNVAEFASKPEALAMARQLCPSSESAERGSPATATAAAPKG